MTAIANLTRAELRKLATGRAFLITLAVSAGLAVTSVFAIAVAAGKNGVPALSTTAGADAMLKLGIVCCVAMLVLGILASGGEYRHKTIIPAMLITPRRGAPSPVWGNTDTPSPTSARSAGSVPAGS